jgi:hypothetical protein
MASLASRPEQAAISFYWTRGGKGVMIRYVKRPPAAARHVVKP